MLKTKLEKLEMQCGAKTSKSFGSLSSPEFCSLEADVRINTAALISVVLAYMLTAD